MLALAQRVFEKCILEKLRSRVKPLEIKRIFARRCLAFTNYQIASGLAAYGHTELATEIADKTVANAILHGINEHYDSAAGKPLGVPDYCISSALVTMIIDGLTRKHRLILRGIRE